MNKETLVKKLGEYFKERKERKDVAFAYLFGSVAKDRVHSESDVDIGVYFTPETAALEYESEKECARETQICKGGWRIWLMPALTWQKSS